MEAYPVPFRVERSADRLRLINRGSSPVRWVRFHAHGAGVAVARPIPSLSVGGSINVRLASPDLSRDTLLVVQWVRDDGETYLMSIAL